MSVSVQSVKIVINRGVGDNKFLSYVGQ